LALPFSFYDKEQTGRLMSRVSSDVESTRIFLSQILIDAMSHFLTIILATIAFLEQDLTLTLIAIVPVLLSGAAMYYAHQELTEPWASQHERMANMSATLQDNLSGIKVLKAFAQEEQAQGRFQEVQGAVRTGSLNISDLWSKRWALIGSIGRFMQLGLLLIGGYRVMNEELSLGSLVAVLSLSLLLLGAVNALGTQLNSVSQTATAAVRIFELLDEPVTIQSPAPPSDPVAAQHTFTPRRPDAWRGEIEYKDVSFIYPTAKAKTLIDINLRIPAGSSLAVVGATGSGKSTLIHLIGRFYDPTSGHVQVDGRDVRSLDLTELRSQIGMVAQDTLLFSATIADNIAFGRPNTSQAEIERVAKLAQAHDFVTAMPEGYRTRIGERGAGLSGGQRQRIAIARAMLLDPKILILDDSMSAVDAETERLLQAAIATVMKGRTTILVAHRLATAQHADHIIVLRDGQIVEQGTHAQLDAAGGHYHHVLEMQQMSARESVPDLLIPQAA
jgi:ATP-binding cassette subfamily B protein